MMLWNILLTMVLGIIGYFLREKSAEVQRISILLNKTREEMARDYVTKGELRQDFDRVMDRLDALDAKIDRLIEKG